MASRVPTTESIGNLLKIKGRRACFQRRVQYFGGIDLNDRKVCQQFSPGAKLVGNAGIAQCNDGPGAASATIVVSMDDRGGKIKPFFFAEASYKKLTNGLRACGIVAERFLQEFLRGQNKTTREPPFFMPTQGQRENFENARERKTD